MTNYPSADDLKAAMARESMEMDRARNGDTHDGPKYLYYPHKQRPFIRAFRRGKLVNLKAYRYSVPVIRRVPNPRRHGKYGKVGFCSGAQECARRRGVDPGAGNITNLSKALQHRKELSHV